MTEMMKRTEVAPALPGPVTSPGDHQGGAGSPIRVLMLVAAINSLVMTMPGPVISLLADRLTGSQVSAGIAQAAIAAGAVVASLPLAGLSRRHGRRLGIAVGYLTGALGALLVVIGAAADSYVMLLPGGLGVGAAIAAGMQARFAALEATDQSRYGRAIGTLTMVSALGGAAGPLLVGVTGRLTGSLPLYGGPFVLVAAGLVVSTLAVLLGLGRRPSQDDRPEPPKHRFASILAAMRDPGARRAIIGLLTVQGIMISLMNMAAIHLHHGGATLHVVGLAFSGHVAAMFLPAPLIGHLVDRLGPGPMITSGLLLELLAAAVLATAPPHDAPAVTVGLVLLGLGWSSGYVAGSVQLTTATPPARRIQVQGAADFLTLLTAATGALLAGTVVATWGYTGLAYGAAAAALLTLTTTTSGGFGRRCRSTADPGRRTGRRSAR
jgi:MFS family permease